MADRFEVAVVTCAFSTPVNAPVEVALGFPGGILRAFEIVIPAGHAGLTGIALGYGHRAVIPFTQPAYFSGDDDIIRRAYKDVVPGVAWSAFLCNLDLQNHRWEVRFDYDELTVTPATTTTPDITAQDILDAGAAAVAGQ